MAMIGRFRSARRDNETDTARIDAVTLELRKALRSIEMECAGLSKRVQEASSRAACLMGNEDGIYSEREPADEALLVEAEREMMQAYRRLAALTAQQTIFARVLDTMTADLALAAQDGQSQGTPTSTGR
ncbi:hypothetical protein SAMN05216304_110111 [Bosea sp. OK403]|nr:hypothetical protein SAMN05216304_110111 [Bosea sp. OK403]